jgi:hypothetical protein
MIILIYLLGKTTEAGTLTLGAAVTTVGPVLEPTERTVGLGDGNNTRLGPFRNRLGWLGADDSVAAVGLGGEHCYTTILFFL